MSALSILLWTCRKYHSEENFFFLANKKTFFVPAQWAKSFYIFVNFFPAGCDNCILCVLRIILMKELFCNKLFFFIILIGYPANIFMALCLKILRSNVKSAFYVSVGYRKSLKKFFFWKKHLFFNLFWQRAGKFWPFIEHFFARLSKLHSTCPEELFWIFLGKIKCFLLISNFEQNFLAICWKVISEVVKTAFCMSGGTFWWKNFFGGNFSNF